ncbi:unnamed protein product [marine sediment metagenome]|uniref:Uncharacterized protein n=1 Tax=marine sediment metagenome TaxID=412755 RepID=X0SBQ0_9ZZZZ
MIPHPAAVESRVTGEGTVADGGKRINEVDAPTFIGAAIGDGEAIKHGSHDADTIEYYDSIRIFRI